MKKKRRKGSKCLNCGLDLEESFDYCPACGQENNDNQVSFGSLLNDFFANYFSLDSRFGRSVKPFFLKPGELTREFMDGKRVKYANPIRLYLVVSLIHFFFFSFHAEISSQEGDQIIQIGENEPREIATLPDTLVQKSDAKNTSPEVEEAVDNDIEIDMEDSDWPFSDEEWDIIYAMANSKEYDYSIATIEDSVHNDQKSFTASFITRKTIKLLKSDKHIINGKIVQNIPLSMFFLLPISALLLKALFRKRLYINHLIHTLHLHSFVFITLTFFWILVLFIPEPSAIITIPFLLMNIGYVILSFRNTYQVKYITAIAKVSLVGFIYTILLCITLILVVLLSLLFF
ncbi:MAG: DUF3667 domain-containing protein [Cyclobacteriaceae bacterium]